ncbi:helix-turn-helix transcriptional regulator [Laspinema sp. D1]|uniref:Helix-turn-helix transcriptional regulator n=1 Tax=Laspinema palackyanum D2a TaxID=2953684 RepID=A0ABT2MK75_9CYAN|nr:helix-turn-helix transcriptional regulator [Laspinema sp. D3c]MCT7965142.1 helix-turn-helix transcriptional regulator [Laspinema sp. D2a]MCT7992394.1 helix-turn-helix transcriptional regulator [Laspinema sp. D3c]
MRAVSIVDLDEQQRLGELLKYLRGSQSQREFGKKIGVSHPTISAWENCQWEPSEKYLQKIAELSGATLGDLKAYLQSNHSPETFVILKDEPNIPTGVPTETSFRSDFNLETTYSLNQIARILRILADMLDPPQPPNSNS